MTWMMWLAIAALCGVVVCAFALLARSVRVKDAISLAQTAVATGLALNHRVGGIGPTLSDVIEGALLRAESDEELATLIDLKRKLHANGECDLSRDDKTTAQDGISATVAGESGQSQTQDASPDSVVVSPREAFERTNDRRDPIRLVTPPKPEDQARANMLEMLDEMRTKVEAGDVKGIVILADAVDGGWYDRASSSASFPRWVGELTMLLQRVIARRNAQDFQPQPPTPAA